MASADVSVRAVKRKLRAALELVRLLNQELVDLGDALPCPDEEDFEAMLNFKAPLTQEAALLGLVNLGQFHLSEAVETLSLALSTRGSLKSALLQWSQRPDLRNSLTNVLASRSDKYQASRQIENEE